MTDVCFWAGPSGAELTWESWNAERAGSDKSWKQNAEECSAEERAAAGLLISSSIPSFVLCNRGSSQIEAGLWKADSALLICAGAEWAERERKGWTGQWTAANQAAGGEPEKLFAAAAEGKRPLEGFSSLHIWNLNSPHFDISVETCVWCCCQEEVMMQMTKQMEIQQSSVTEKRERSLSRTSEVRGFCLQVGGSDVSFA